MVGNGSFIKMEIGWTHGLTGWKLRMDGWDGYKLEIG